MQRCRSGWLWAIFFIIGLCVATSVQGADSEVVTLITGRSTVIRAPWPTVRVAVTDPKVADVQVLTPEQILVQGLSVGSTDLILWSEDEQETWQRRVQVTLDVETIRNTLVRLFPTGELQVSDSGEVLLVQGLLRSAEQARQLQNYLEKTKVEFVDMTSVAGIQQVQLQVRVAEVSRAATRALGISGYQTDAAGGRMFWGQRLNAPEINIGAAGGQPAGDNLLFVTPEDGIGASSLVTLFAGFPNSNLEIFLQALAENQYLRLLANPTLIALSGEQADFLAGGEFPIPVPQTSGGASGTITIEYKEFGVRLRFRPIVLGDGGIHLHAIQEVSELTDTGSVTIEGYNVPGLITRRAETTLELKSGQSFAIAGLIQNKDSAINSRIPGLGDLPILGPLFRSVRYQNSETELVILVTASLIEPMNMANRPPVPGVTHAPPNDWELYLEGRLEAAEPARLDPATAEAMRQMGLDKLVGPGAWDAHDGKAAPAAPPSEETEPIANGARIKVRAWDVPSDWIADVP
ncbi:type II and III secretion system protein family protein [Anaerobaca lacustris]|uniref:Type II and III secretion system protein family protein n=1 Tax=Anaerobaca lacustris TaxID=3044600 RepID=A0AAW6U9C1_9BACT|nr:type II and III secretion system protein family protein [Sedimentisphaerales bacterium M17dextr]